MTPHLDRKLGDVLIRKNDKRAQWTVKGINTLNGDLYLELGDLSLERGDLGPLYLGRCDYMTTVTAKTADQWTTTDAVAVADATEKK